MTKKLSDLNASLTFVPSALSPMPAGTLQAYGGSTVPEGWLEADGSAVSRSTYADLFAVIGVTYGAGDASTTFNLPTGGPPVTTEWAAYTPTTQGLGTISSVNTQWRQVGENIEIGGDFTAGTPTASEAQIELPNSYTVDWKNSTGTVSVGNLERDEATSLRINPVLATDGDTFLNVGSDTDGGTLNPLSPVLGTNMTVAGWRFAIRASVPVAELSGLGISIIKAYPDSSSISMSIKDATATDTGAVRLSSDFAATETAYGFVKAPIMGRFYRNAGYSYTANTAYAFDTASTLLDNIGITNTAGVFTFDSAGTYRVTTSLRKTTAYTTTFLQLYKGGVLATNIDEISSGQLITGSVTVTLAAGENINVNMTSSVTASVGDTNCWVEIIQVPGT